MFVFSSEQLQLLKTAPVGVPNHSAKVKTGDILIIPRYCPVGQGHTGRMYSPCPEHRALPLRRNKVYQCYLSGKQGVQVLPLRGNKVYKYYLSGKTRCTSVTSQRNKVYKCYLSGETRCTSVTSQEKQGVQVLPLRKTRCTSVTSQGKQGVPVLPLRGNKERVQAKDPPAHYLNKLRTYLDPKASRSSRVTLLQQGIEPLTFLAGNIPLPAGHRTPDISNSASVGESVVELNCGPGSPKLLFIGGELLFVMLIQDCNSWTRFRLGARLDLAPKDSSLVPLPCGNRVDLEYMTLTYSGTRQSFHGPLHNVFPFGCLTIMVLMCLLQLRHWCACYNTDIGAVILGDSLKKWLIPPLNRNPDEPIEHRFNRCHKKTRRLVENSIGIWKERFPCLNCLRLSPVRADKIVLATATLHNIACEASPNAELSTEHEGVCYPFYCGFAWSGLVSSKSSFRATRRRSRGSMCGVLFGGRCLL
uniref:DDE Tnp4 domain-containing protein n=1 Tax=Timema shepardi TaxID=629360 RepID=A0A7R9B617_TIMSH|nr:unnamed protein product [Timema shepardi]